MYVNDDFFPQILITADHRDPTRYGRYPKLRRIRIHTLRRFPLRLASRLGMVRWAVTGRLRIDWLWHGRIIVRRGQAA